MALELHWCQVNRASWWHDSAACHFALPLLRRPAKRHGEIAPGFGQRFGTVDADCFFAEFDELALRGGGGELKYRRLLIGRSRLLLLGVDQRVLMFLPE